MWKFKSWKGKDKWLFLLSMGVILCILAFPTEGLAPDNKAKAVRAETEVIPAAAPAKGSDAYEAELENRVKELLKNVDGVGKVDVMILLKSTGEKVVRVDSDTSRAITEETDSGGGSRKVENEERSESTVLTSGSGNNTPIIEKEIRPELSGIIISAAGGGSPKVQAEISAAMEALFGLPAHKIKVLKRVE